jgi:hypothetical protein
MFFFGVVRSLHAMKVLLGAFGTRLAAVTTSFQHEMQRSVESNEHLQRALADLRNSIRSGSKRAFREKSHAAIMATEQRARRVPPVSPPWITRRAPWAQYWCTHIPRGRRRTRAWT